MSREKQIEKMADILCEAKEHDCKGGNDCLCVKQAEALYNAHYKQLPCKIGDAAWAVRSYKGTLSAQQGIVSEMFYTGEQMKLCIVVKHIARGEWGKDIFPTYEEAIQAIKERERGK